MSENENKTIVFTNGCFDIIHSGHIKLLEYCASLGSVIVGLNSDQSIKRLKGEGRPINTQADRLLVLSALKYVDRVELFEEDTPYQLIQSIKPDIIVKGGDYKPGDVIGRDLAEVKIFPLLLGRSTTQTILDLSTIEE